MQPQNRGGLQNQQEHHIILTKYEAVHPTAVSENKVFTSYSKDEREKEAKYWSLNEKVKGQPSCNSLVALYFWRNIFTPLNHRCIQLRKQMKDDYWNTPRTSKVKKVISQGQ